MDAYLMHAVSADPLLLPCVYEVTHHSLLYVIFWPWPSFIIFLFSDKSCFQNKRYCEQEQHRTEQEQTYKGTTEQTGGDS